MFSTTYRATMSANGRVTIPKEMRMELGWTQGTRLSFVRHDDGTVLIRVAEPKYVSV